MIHIYPIQRTGFSKINLFDVQKFALKYIVLLTGLWAEDPTKLLEQYARTTYVCSMSHVIDVTGFYWMNEDSLIYVMVVLDRTGCLLRCNISRVSDLIDSYPDG